MNTARRVAAGAATISAAMLLTGCGGSAGNGGFADKSAAEIEDAAKKDMKEVSSLTMDASLKQADGQLEMKISMDDEADCLVDMKKQGASAEIIVVKGETAYMKADEKFYKLTGESGRDPAVLALIADKWVKYPAEKTKSFCNLEDFLESFEEEDDEKSKKGDETEVDGEEVVELISEDDDETTTASIATEGKHYVLRMETEGGDEPGSIALSDYDEDVKAEEPDDVVEIPKS